MVFFFFFYIFLVIGYPIIRGAEGMPLTDLTQSHFNAFPWTWTFNAICHGLYGVKLFEKTGCLFVCFVDISGIVDHHCLEVIVLFVDISRIVDHHCLNCLLLILVELLTITV